MNTEPTTRRVWAAMSAYQTQYRRLVTIEQVMHLMYFASKSVAHYHVRKLVALGYVRQITPGHHYRVEVPLYEARHA